MTAGRGDAERCVAARAGRIDCVVVAGGDGTLNEVLNGLPEPGALPLVPFAVGTGNMLARELGLPRTPERLANVIAEGAIRRIDMGEVEGHRFLSLLSSGFDAMVAGRIARTRRGTFPYASYARPILETLWRYRPPRLSVSLDGAAPVAGGLVLASNLRNYGGVLELTRDARCDSGALEVLILERAAALDLVRLAIPAALRRPPPRKGVVQARVQTLRVAGELPVPVQVDGDAWGSTPVTVRLWPGAVRVFVPGTKRPGGAPDDEAFHGPKGP